jgi:hypothetical protein
MFQDTLFSMVCAYLGGLNKWYRDILSVGFSARTDPTLLETQSGILTSCQGFELTWPFFKPSIAAPTEQSVPSIQEKWCKLSHPHGQ